MSSSFTARQRSFSHVRHRAHRRPPGHLGLCSEPAHRFFDPPSSISPYPPGQHPPVNAARASGSPARSHHTDGIGRSVTTTLPAVPSDPSTAFVDCLPKSSAPTLYLLDRSTSAVPSPLPTGGGIQARLPLPSDGFQADLTATPVAVTTAPVVTATPVARAAPVVTAIPVATIAPVVDDFVHLDHPGGQSSALRHGHSGGFDHSGGG